MTVNKEIVNAETYKEFREEIYSKVVSATNGYLNLDPKSTSIPVLDSMLKTVHGKVFTTLNRQIETLSKAGANGEDIKEFIRTVAPVIENTALIAGKIQDVTAKYKEFIEYETQVNSELEKTEIELLGYKRDPFKEFSEKTNK